MTTSKDGYDASSELNEFRRDADRLGFVSEVEPDRLIGLESADDFIARMKRQDAQPAGSRRRLRWASLALAGIAATVALVFGLARPGGSPAAADAPPLLDFEFASALRIAYAPGEDPRATLALLADAAAEAPPSGSGGIQYKQTDNWFTDTDDSGNSSIVPRFSQTWLRPDGSLTTHEALGLPLTPDGRGAVANTAAEAEVKETLAAGTVDATFAASLPAAPGPLALALLDHSECEQREVSSTRSMCLYREIVNLYRTYVVPTKLSASLWRMLELEAGFTSLGSVEDRAGRDAVGISIIDTDAPHIRYVLFGSLDDGQVIGSEEILIKPDPDVQVRPPTVLSFSTYLDSRLTSTAPD